VSSYISGGSSYAVLLDQQAYARGSSTNIDGPCHDSSEAPLPLLPHAGNTNSSSSNRPVHVGHAGAAEAAAAAAGGGEDVPLRQKYAVASAQQFQAVTPQQQQQQQQHDTEMWQQPPAAAVLHERCSHLRCSSPFSTEGCSEASSPDMLLYVAGGGSSSRDEHRHSSGMLISEKLLVKDAAAAAALFPAEQGAFAVEQRMY
jgi:hypothetical protein